MRKLNKRTILVLTDFSEHAKNAAECALDLALKMSADLILINIYPVPTILSSTEIPFPFEYYTIARAESIHNLKLEKTRLQSVFKKNAGIPEITCLHEGCSFSRLAHWIRGEKNIMMIVMGGRHLKGNEFLFGSSINVMVDKSDCPVLLISEKKQVSAVKNVVFVTDLAIEDIQQLKKLIELSTLFEFHIHVCHVSPPTPVVIDFNEDYRLSDFIYEMDKLAFKKVSYKNLQGKNIVQNLIAFHEGIHADLLVLVHKKNSLFWKLFHQSTSRELVRNQKSPLLILPA